MTYGQNISLILKTISAIREWNGNKDDFVWMHPIDSEWKNVLIIHF